MSLALTALSMAAFEALCPYTTRQTGPWPTRAGNRVFLERLDEIAGDASAFDEFLTKVEGRPVAMIYAEHDEMEPYGGIKYPAQENITHLTIETLIAANGSVTFERADGSIATIGSRESPATDIQIDTVLKTLCSEIVHLLGKKVGEDRPPSSKIYNSVVMEVHNYRSVPQRNAERAVRIVARTITLLVKIKSETWPRNFASGGSAPTGFDVLPAPLAAVAKQLDPASPNYALCQEIATWVAPPIALGPAADVRVFSTIDPHSPPTQSDGSDSDVLADVNLAGS